ncbi:MAG: hypothetical protein ACOC7V_02100 [Spirochaetota bacterium]
MSLIFLAMGACVTGRAPDGDARERIRTVRVTLDYPDGCEPTEGFAHRFLVGGDGVKGDDVAGEPTDIADPTEPFPAAVPPGGTLTILTAVCRSDDGACCPVTVERVFETGREPPAAIVVVIPDPRESR